MRLVFMGSPDFAVPALRALHEAGHEIACVYCQPPRPAGRGHAVTPSPVQRAAERLGLPVRTPARLRRVPEEHAAFAALGLDAAVVAAYGLILPAEMLGAPARGCLNIHASLLPRWRGASPIQAAVLAGDTETGVTIMRMDEGLDTGPMLRAARVPIDAATTAAALHDTLAELGAGLIVDVLANPPEEVPQPERGVTYAPKLSRADGAIDWRDDAHAIARRIRALNPWPGTTAMLDGAPLKVLAAEPMADTGGSAPSDAPPGTVLDAAFTVACGRGALRLQSVQRPGRPAIDGAAMLRGLRRTPPFLLENAPFATPRHEVS